MSTVTVTIRGERSGEEARVRAVNDAAFGRSLEGAIVDAIRGTDRWVDGGSLVAEAADGTIVGHLLISEGDLTSAGTEPDRRIWLIGPLAVVPHRQREGIGSQLMTRAIEFATAHGQPVLCLLGHAEYYPRFGFTPAREMGLEPPQPWSDENWLALRLPGWTESVRGTVRYPPAFSVDGGGTGEDDG